MPLTIAPPVAAGRRARSWALAAVVAGSFLLPTAAGATVRLCPGDCQEQGVVTRENLLLGLRIALGEQALAGCGALDRSRDGKVTVDDLIAALRSLRNGCFGPPSLSSSLPEHNAGGVPRTAWLVLEVESGHALEDLTGFHLDCDGESPALVASALGGRTIVLNPTGELPPDSECALEFASTRGPERLSFRTAGPGEPVVPLYDREDPALVAPYPDDVLLALDETTRTGRRLAMPVPELPVDVAFVFTALLDEGNQLDGFSSIGHMVIELSEALDPRSLPLTPAESLEPLATLGLFDLTPGSPRRGRRVPFRLDVRDDVTARGLRSHTLLLFPSVPLEPEGRYGLVLTRRAYGDPRRPLAPSDAFARVLAEPAGGEAEVVTRARQLTSEILEAVAEGVPPIHPWDVALATSVSIRSTDDIPRDMLAIREQIHAMPPPVYTIDSVAWDEEFPIRFYVVRGTWEAPDFRDGPNLARDEEGRPVLIRTRPVPFVLAVPGGSSGPAPVVMHQHGNPGSLEEVLGSARRFLADAGFAAIGFTDILNREIAPTGSQDQRITTQTVNVLNNLLMNSRLPDHWVQTRAEQVAFLRFVQQLADLDVLPLPVPDGVPDLDLSAPLTYHGISEGANNGQGLLAYAPELRAAALVVGGARLTETLIHQQTAAFLNQLPLFFPSIHPAEIWVGFALFQAIFDVQDNHSHLPFLYRRPLDLGGSTRRASVLVIEGLDDTLVPNHATQSLAYSLGPVPHVQPVQRETVILEAVMGPLEANIDAETTAGFYQYVPVGVPGIDPTPSCAVVGQTEGHFCPQVASESIVQRLVFLESAVFDEVPVIIDPLVDLGGVASVPPMANEVAGAR